MTSGHIVNDSQKSSVCVYHFLIQKNRTKLNVNFYNYQFPLRTEIFCMVKCFKTFLRWTAHKTNLLYWSYYQAYREEENRSKDHTTLILPGILRTIIQNGILNYSFRIHSNRLVYLVFLVIFKNKWIKEYFTRDETFFKEKNTSPV